jgi:hypothetical protein
VLLHRRYFVPGLVVEEPLVPVPVPAPEPIPVLPEPLELPPIPELLPPLPLPTLGVVPTLEPEELVEPPVVVESVELLLPGVVEEVTPRLRRHCSF